MGDIGADKSTGYPSCPTCHSDLESLIPAPPVSPSGSFLSISSCPMTVAEGANLRDAVSLAIANREALMAAVKQLENLTKDCIESIRIHDKFIKEHRPVLSLVRRLPAEIWGEVFDWAVLLRPRGPKSYVFTPASRIASPFNISHVCHDWRRIAIRRSSLWREIHFSILDSMPSSKMNLLALWLSRSGSHPLFITIGQRTGNVSYDRLMLQDPIGNTMEKLFSTLKSQSRRLLEASFSLQPDILRILLRTPLSPTPLLRNLDVSNVEKLSDDIWAPILLGSSGNLASLTISKFKLSRSATMELVPWQSLKHVSLSETCCSLILILDILSTCPQLTSLKAECKGPDSSVSHTKSHDVLSELDLWCPPSALEFLVLPSLTKLTLRRRMSASDPIAMFISRSPSLTILDVNCSNMGFLSKLSSSNKVQDIDLGILIDSPLTDELDNITVLKDIANSHFLPKLETLRIWFGFVSSDIEDVYPSLLLKEAVVALVQTIAHANGAESCLKTVRLDVSLRKGPSPIVLEPLHDLAELKLDGLKVRFVKD